MPNDGLNCVCGQSAVKPCIRRERLSTFRRLHMWIRMTMWLSCWQSHWVVQSESSLFEYFAAYIPCTRGVWTVRRRGLSRSCRPQELEPLPLTSVWVMWELELWASVTPVLFFFLLVGWWLINPMWYTFELIPHWFEGSVSVLCYLEGLFQAKHTTMSCQRFQSL